MFWIRKMMCSLAGHNFDYDKQKWQIDIFGGDKQLHSHQYFCKRCQQFKNKDNPKITILDSKITITKGTNNGKNKTVRG